ncbi:hypothetical protein M407DRAFT_170036 [Tulasnella calospora MUT 4182]|uniref:Extracellular membrane protein CFEM domain-containing protein n=1 Tax=Tulasnella calospora MUT 4182 TaxID=1051891 RepID=A0A0C3M702_9AGAM|nr:hypothetical protein M407DRAFT_170036 [Tulasnella calospora MUT 4182]
MRSFAALSVILAASTAVLASPSSDVSLNPRDLIARQTTSPTTCQAECQPVTDQMTKCAADLGCMCDGGVANPYYNCLQCGYKVADADIKSTMQQGWQAYLDACKSAGHPVSQSAALSGSSSSSSSTGTNSNTGSSSGNGASHSTSLGFIGLGALALGVSSLF